MKLAVITHTTHIQEKEALYAYGPYVREMNIWTKHAEEVILVAPISKNKIDSIYEAYRSKNIVLRVIPAISFVSATEAIHALVRLPIIKWRIFQAMRQADHIHLRCPGTIGLVGCCLQIFFPKKPKTAKYAGNWDPNSKQPLSYRLQKWILANTFLTRNMKVLVYGDWPNQSKNIQPFFTASYPNNKIESFADKNFEPPFRFLFVGSLAPGKRPLYAVQLIHELQKKGVDCFLDMYGEGAERGILENYIAQHNLSEKIRLHGNCRSEDVETAYKNSDLLILPSISEGWPKVVAEAMFWGVVPVVTKISCVPWMLNEGDRGIFLEADLERDALHLWEQLRDVPSLMVRSEKAQQWSRQYTMDSFEAAIKKMIV